jgi:hypothetical protein
MNFTSRVLTEGKKGSISIFLIFMSSCAAEQKIYGYCNMQKSNSIFIFPLPLDV